MSNQVKNRRSQKIVDKELQTQIITQVSWPMALVMIITAAILIMFGLHLKRQAVLLDVEFTGFMPLIVSTAVLFLFAAISQIMIALIVSHRIAGSAYRVMETMKSFREGDSDVRAHLREGDLHTQLAREVNSFLDWVHAGTPSEDVPPGKSSAKPSAPSKKAVHSQAGV